MSRISLYSRERGVTLIELMVALVIGLVLSLAMFAVMTAAEGRKRTITSTSDASQVGNYAMVLLDQWLRNAGSGFSKSAAYSFGCTLKAYRDSTQILPADAALPSPFGSVNTGTNGVFRLAPVLILPGQTTPGVSTKKSDVLVIMGGAAGTGGVPVAFSGLPTTTQLALSNTTAFAQGDLLLLATKEPSSTANYSGGSNGSGTITSVNASDCLIDQVSGSFSAGASALGLDGTYLSNQAASLSDNSAAMVLGNVGAGRSPQFLIIGVGDNNTLYSYDLLNTTGDGTRLQARADGVFELHALYGIDKNCDGKISSNEWVSPTDTTYSVSALMSGSMQEVSNQPADALTRKTVCASLTTANDYLQKILAIRVGLILRTNLPEKDSVSLNALSLFTDLNANLKYTRALTGQEQHYRYRTVELTIPLRNPLMLP